MHRHVLGAVSFKESKHLVGFSGNNINVKVPREIASNSDTKVHLRLHTFQFSACFNVVGVVKAVLLAGDVKVFAFHWLESELVL